MHAKVGFASFVVWFVGFLSGTPVRSPVQESAVIDDCQYADDAEAAGAWQSLWGTASARAASVDGRRALRLPCNFAGTKFDRGVWDRSLDLDLSQCRGVQFELLCRNTTPISQCTIYFQSGSGWYAGHFTPEAEGRWCTVRIDKASTRTEGKPAGWGQVRTIRLSFWRGTDADTEVYLREFRKTGVLGVDARVAIVRGESAAARPAEAQAARQFADTTATALRDIGVDYGVLSDLEITPEKLKGVRLVVLPHNPAMPDAAAQELASYIEGGGKLLTFYGMHPQLRKIARIEAGPFVKETYPGYFSTIQFQDGALSGAPQRVAQQSWNILEPKPMAGASRVLADWLNDKGEPTGHAAIVASANCIEMSHVLLPGDPQNKRLMLLAMIGYLAPELLADVVKHRIDEISGLADYRDFDDAVTRIGQAALADQLVRQCLDQARRLRESAISLQTQQRYAEAAQQAGEARQQLVEAYCRSQQPAPGEFRAFWCHSAFGVEGMDWDAAIGRLADSGFTAILPNMLWGGVAYYPSDVLPVSPSVAERGDQIAQCLAACRKHGLQVHVWKVNWNLGHGVPREFVESLRRQNRLQLAVDGSDTAHGTPWLCPSHPENQKLEIDAMVEVARKYAVDGLHFDYIRYPDGNHCFCPGCRERFSKSLGKSVVNWPADVLQSGPLRQRWLDWRRQNISTVVKAVSEQARQVRPGIKLSAAVFRNWATDRDGVGQDWKLWCDRGWLDFVCPMDYTTSDNTFNNWIKQQKGWAGNVPVYPGIGAHEFPGRPDRVIGQILITRRHQTNGFTVFNYGPDESRDLVPLLGLGIGRAP